MQIYLKHKQRRSALTHERETEISEMVRETADL